MGNIRKYFTGNLLLIAWCSAFGVLLYLHVKSCDVRGTFPLPIGLKLTENRRTTTGPNEPDRLPSVEKTNIFFLKTHKCGSSTVQNILMRFGYSRHLDFVLPERYNYLGHPELFDPAFISPDFRMPNHTFNVFTHHTRYNRTTVNSVMKAGAAFVTILREPSDLFESLFTFYHMEKYLRNRNLKDVIKTPQLWQVVKDRTLLRKFGADQMSFDLGYDSPSGPWDDDAVSKFIRELDEDFDLVMIMEYMEVSLVLLCDLMKWPLEYVVFLQLNARPLSSVVKLTPGERHALLELNAIDAELYDYFLAKFKRRVVDFGTAKMKSSVDRLLNLNSDLWRNCVDKPNRSGYGRTLGYDLRNKDFLCFFATLNELEFTDLIRNDQRQRFHVMRRLDALIADTVK